jgi:hypothetical protein
MCPRAGLGGMEMRTMSHPAGTEPRVDGRPAPSLATMLTELLRRLNKYIHVFMAVENWIVKRTIYLTDYTASHARTWYTS